MEELIICVAPYPGEKQEEKFPGKLNVAEEVLSSYNAGASIAHLHVRDANGLQTVDTTQFRADIEKISAQSPMIIEGSTGGAPEHRLEQRCISFTVPGVEMGSLNLGSINLWDGVYSNRIADILFYAGELHKRSLKPFMDCFDLSHFSSVRTLESKQLLSEPYIFGLVFDIPNALPYTDRYLDFFLKELPDDCIWFLTRHHAKGSSSFLRALERGGHVRVGFEDGPFLSNGKRARSNAELVEDIATAARQVGRKVVDPDRARDIMRLSAK
jgi:3-keto-5-aminohexanoate cleavage enzyme